MKNFLNDPIRVSIVSKRSFWFFPGIIHASDDHHNANLAQNEYQITRLNQVSLFQVVTESRAVTTPLLNHASELMVHYTEAKMGTRFHWLNIMDNTTNTEYIQFGMPEVSFSTKITCAAINFTQVTFDYYTLAACYKNAFLPKKKNFGVINFLSGRKSSILFPATKLPLKCGK